VIQVQHTNDSGKEEKVEESVLVCACGSPAFPSVDPPLSFSIPDGGGGVPNLPIFFNHPKICGSLPPAHPTSTPSKPLCGVPLAHTAANASPICLNGTSAVPYFGGLFGAFFGGFKDSTIDVVSVLPKGAKRSESDAGVVRLG